MPGNKSDTKLAALLSAAAVLAACPAAAADRYVENILISRSGEEATVQISLACPMRLESDLATDGGTVVEVHLSALEACHLLGDDGQASELYRPVGGDLADLAQVEYESLGVGESFVVLRFNGPVDYRVAQRGNLRSLEILVRSSQTPRRAPDAAVSNLSARAAQPAPAAPPERPSAPDTERTPLTMRVRAPQTKDDYVVNLVSSREPVSPALIDSLPSAPGQRLYVSDITVDGATWHRLRLGFFASEAAARAALQPLSEQFPRAWIGRAEPREVDTVSSDAFTRGDVVSASASASAAARSVAVPAGRAGGVVNGADKRAAPAAAQDTGGQALSEEQIATLFAQARDATLDGKLPAAIDLYKRLLRTPGDHRAQARELLGVAFEKNGQADYAQAEYRAYLEQYPNGDGAARVRQRLNGLLTANATPSEPLHRSTGGDAAPGPAEKPAHWEMATGVSQYYRRDVQQLDSSPDQVVTLSALSTDLDLSMSRTGGRMDVLSRITVNHMADLLGDGQGGSGDQSRLYYAYVDLDPNQRNWSLRFGRQSLHHWGVLGRFDGAHFTYDWATNRRLHFTTGYPVESPADSLGSNRRFEGVAVDFDRLFGDWNFSTFLNHQTIGGIEDRQAAGFELSYLGQSRSLSSIVDYDIGYGTLNTVLALGTWRLPNRITFTALLDMRKSPILTTRNALIGQPVDSIDELLLSFTEDQIRQLALDRTADTTTTTLGIAKPIAERFQLNADLTVTKIDGTTASAGVPAVPDMGTQTFYSTSLVGSGLFGSHDVSIFNLRYGQSDTFTTSQLTYDVRFPLGRHLRLNPRLQLMTWEGLLDGVRRETLRPSFRLLMNVRGRYRLELEVGDSELMRTQTGTEQNTSDYFVNLGYRVDF